MTMTIYKTSDFLTASVLLMQKHSLLSIDNSDHRRVVFLFEDNEGLQRDLSMLRRGKLLVEPSDFWAAERRCKQLIHESGRL